MTTFNSAFDWDTNLPPSISSLDENDFLLLLQKQFPAVSGEPIAPSALTKGKINVGANPQSLTKFPLTNTTSPLSTDSSPSPPSANEDGSGDGSDGNNNGSHKRAGSADDDHHKRKASADDFDDEIGGQPSAKSQHTDSKSKKPNNNRRKSSGGERTQDESRLLKRKEQNRAAQRAFRERKEKHVKDLEDKVAELVTKTENQATENENLRDMLSRLQNENVVLKQTAFTFSVPASSNKASPDQSRDSPSDALNLFASSSSTPGPSSVPASAGSSVATASTHDSPSSIFDGFESFSGMNNLPTSDSPVASSSSAATPAVNATTSSPDLDTIAFFGSPGPFTTLSSNPMYTSYRDPMESMNAFASFGGWDGDITMASSNDNSNAGLEELFGEQFSGLVPFNDQFLTGDAKNSPSGSSAASGLSPVGHHKSASPSHTGDGCPKTKQDVERMIASGETSTFGAPPVVEGKGSIPTLGASPGSASVGSPGNEIDAAFEKALGRTAAPAPTKPKYTGENFNIDELCLEMQRKAKCSYAASTGGQC